MHVLCVAEHRGIVSPVIVEHTGTVHVAQDEGAALLCVAQGCPNPEYRYDPILPSVSECQRRSA